VLNGVAHDIAHHAQSGLSWLYPHLGNACRQAGVLTASVELMEQEPYPPSLPMSEPLALALSALRQTLVTMLKKHGFELGDLTSARLEFTFPSGYGDGSLYQVRSIVLSRGRTFARFLPMIGEPVKSKRGLGPTTIYVKLLDEGVECWRPVQALEKPPGCFKIVGPVPEDERWEFEPGQLVRCRLDDARTLVAVERIG
jgi:hypothetical protein